MKTKKLQSRSEREGRTDAFVLFVVVFCLLSFCVSIRLLSFLTLIAGSSSSLSFDLPFATILRKFAPSEGRRGFSFRFVFSPGEAEKQKRQSVNHSLAIAILLFHYYLLNIFTLNCLTFSHLFFLLSYSPLSLLFFLTFFLLFGLPKHNRS